MVNFFPDIQPLPHLFPSSPRVSVLKLHEIHPIVSGNKWYKLAPYLDAALAAGCKRVITRGGAYSNHLIATAWAAREAGLQTRGLVRGQEPPQPSPTLQDARSFGMDLVFLDRSAFATTEKLYGLQEGTHDFYIPAGGSGMPGVRGAASILERSDTGTFTHILVASGTGTMLAGIQLAAAAHQQVVGISVLKNQPEPLPTVAAHLRQLGCNRLPEIIHFPYGGYARRHPEVMEMLHLAWEKENLPLDFVYTGKLFAATRQLIAAGYFPENAHLLLIHSGGLQGNRSLPPGHLPF
jgi:1-aminocyclopropane-1-carboxylate deaminase/D-cysteine desulfhydrase-like pyridoxal-dependent ACC family enzyme